MKKAEFTISTAVKTSNCVHNVLTLCVFFRVALYSLDSLKKSLLCTSNDGNYDE
jgi:hypothetical protein